MREVPVKLGWCESLNYHHKTYPQNGHRCCRCGGSTDIQALLGSRTRQRPPRQQLSPGRHSGRWPTGFWEAPRESRATGWARV